MCVSPVPIPNPNRGSKVDLICRTADTESAYILVPCNHCSECLQSRQSALVQRARSLSIDHYIYFCTLTYNQASLPHVLTSSGYSIPYADIRDVQLMIKRIRKDNLLSRSFLYYFVSERGKVGHRPHFHGLFFFPKYKDDDKLFPAQLESSLRNTLFKEWRRNYGSTRNPDWRPLFNYHTKVVAGKVFRNFDCHYVVPYSTEKGADDVAFYATKYVLKTSDYENKLQQALRLNLEPDEYEFIWRTVKSKSLCSHAFGSATEDEISYVKNCIERSKDDPQGLKYYHSDGTTSPLSRYYRKYLSPEVAISSKKATGLFNDRDESFCDLKSRSQVKGDQIRRKVADREISDLFPND